MDVQQAREQMIDQQIRAWDVLDARVLSVMSAVPRERFVPAAWQLLAFADTMIPLPEGQVMLTPSVEGRMLQSLAVKPGDVALDIGTGSGYTAACLASLGARVTSQEIRPTLASQAAATLSQLGMDTIIVETADAAALKVTEKYDVIAVTGSVPLYENRFANALKVGGRLFLIVGTEPSMEAMLITRTGADTWLNESLFETVVPCLAHFEAAAQFEF